MLGKFVVVRTVYAGVHCGVLKEETADTVVLENTSRIWRWHGANTLSEVSQQGVDHDHSRISDQVPENKIKGVIEIIPCSETAVKNLSTPRWGK